MDAGGPLQGQQVEAPMLTVQLNEREGPSASPACLCGGGRTGASELFGSMWAVASVFFKDEASKRKAWAMVAGNVAAMLVFAGLNLVFLSIFRDFQNSLHDKNAEEFHACLTKICIVAVVMLPVSALRDALGGSLALEWRRFLTLNLLGKYIGDSQAYYRLKFQDADVDNPDQRMVQDTAQFTSAFVTFLGTISQAIIVIFTQSGMLITISPELFAFVVAYAMCMNFLTFVVFGGRLTSVNRVALGQEASVRFGLVRVREHAEAIAFYQGAPFEEMRCGDFFSELMKTLYRKLCLTVAFDSFNGTCGLLISVIPYAIVAGKYLNGDLDFGAMSQSAAVLGSLESSLTILVSRMDSVTSMGAQALRIRQLMDSLGSIDQQQLRRNQEGPYHGAGGSPEPLLEGGELGERAIRVELLPEGAPAWPGEPLLFLDQVTLQPPIGQVPLVRTLSLRVCSGESLLVCGPSGIGKSSLLRAIGGLWSAGCGTIWRCAARQCFFVPQEPYLCLGTLRENATYPGISSSAGAEAKSLEDRAPDDAQIRAALAECRLDYLCDRFGLDASADFDSVLSGGERQRLGFARLLLRPTSLRFAIMDEATSALDEANENAMYKVLQQRVLSYVSVGHRTNLTNFHSHRLLLERTSAGYCSWNLSRLADPSGVLDGENAGTLRSGGDAVNVDRKGELEKLDNQMGFSDAWTAM